MRHVLRGAALALAATLVIVGCDDSGSDGDSGASSSQQTSDAPAGSDPSGSAGAPELPAEAKADDAAGAEAYVRYYVDVINAAAQTGDTETLHAVAAECNYCQQFPAVFDDTYENGGSFDGGFFKLRDVTATVDGTTAKAVAKLEADTSTSFKIAADKKLKKLDPRSYTWTIELEHTGDGWRIVDLKEKF